MRSGALGRSQRMRRRQIVARSQPERILEAVLTFWGFGNQK